MGKVVDLDALLGELEPARASGKTVVLTNGAFDLFHVGHLRCLKAARDHGDVLVVAVNDDASVQRAKGVGRPIVPATERAEIVAGIAGVDWVVLFSEDTVMGLIDALQPDVHAKGTDYTADSIPERQRVRAYGGRVVIAGDPKDHSTTELVAKLHQGAS